MQKLLLLGAESVAQGAIDGGISGVYAYPGTPSTEITEYIQKNKFAKEQGIHSDWSANEKTAMETAIGMSYAGKRSLVCMKHVGLNVAADAFINSGITGANGGLVVAVADDPSMHSSQNEQDSRFYGKFTMIPVLEPSNQQEAYDMTYSAFELSEKSGLPVLLRITTRLSHSRAAVEPQPKTKQNRLKLPENLKQFILLPALARKRYKNLLALQPRLEQYSDKSVFNKYIEGADSKVGLIAAGISINYVTEILGDLTKQAFPIVKIGQYPIPRELINKLMDRCEEVIVFEEGYPLIEEMLKGFLAKENISGRLDGTLPRDGELNPGIVAKALGISIKAGPEPPEIIKTRPPVMCPGCPHIDVYNALNDAIAEYGMGRVFSDIGCYTLGALEPFNAINSCVDMGASITMAKGAADAGLIPSIAVIGDSTFTHSGMTGLLDAVVENSPITVIISDNSTTGMTGGQKSHATGRLYEICKGLGVNEKHIRMLVPLKKNHTEMVAVISEELKYQGVSVIIPQRECIQTAVKSKKSKQK